MNKKEVNQRFTHSCLQKDKRGQGLSTGAIVLIVLGVFVLVILILGFIMGWDKFKGIFGSTDNNVDEIAQQCNIACTEGGQYDFCTYGRELKAPEGDLAEEDREAGSKTASCNFFATDTHYMNFGIAPCPTINCP
ncbi:MAG: hypothetical protein KKB31_00310, partial [Nanoarchaeota archaeon]|nr:hypothetical protein [Nanoarchaeota archaeon]